ncbi:MAG TPA: hypothetical protein PLI45_02430 [Candidatus Woesebacteria bacterium]|nr:hypothetical protein [Candidatus Woesebacteria bacterium]
MKTKKPKKLNRNLKTVILLVLSIPIFFFSLFLFGEVFGGDISGLGHLFQVIPLVLLWIVVYKYF